MTLTKKQLQRVEAEASALVTDEIVHLPITSIDVDPGQPRQDADEELRDSIASVGVRQPITVRPHPEDVDRWMIVDGERRYRGSLAAGRSTIPAMITYEAEDDGDRLLLQLVANTGKPLTPAETAQAYVAIMEAKGWSQQELAKHLGVPRSTVGDRLALAQAPVAFQPLFANGTLTAAAAPIVRQYADVPAEILEKAAKELPESCDFRDAIRDGKRVPLDVVRTALEEVVLEDMWELSDKEVAARYTGPVATIKGKRYGISDEVLKVRQAIQQEKARAAPGRAAEKSRDTFEAERRAQAKAEREKQKKKQEERRARYDAIVAQLPPALSADWLLFIVRWLVDEIQNDVVCYACKLLGLEVEPTKSAYGHVYRDYRGAVTAYAERLDEVGRSRLLVQLLLAKDAQVTPYDNGPQKRFQAAAQLLSLDLKSVKVPKEAPTAKPSKTPKTSGSGKKAATSNKWERRNKRGSAKHARPFMEPQQPDAALAAIVGSKPMPRTQVTTKLWSYIRKHGLQDKQNVRQINADELLRPVFGGRASVSMFEMTKYVNVHLTPAGESGGGLPISGSDESIDSLRDTFAGAEPPATVPTCVYCECTEDQACETMEGPCHWISTDPYVCSAQDCVTAHQARAADAAGEALENILFGEEKEDGEDLDAVGAGDELDDPNDEEELEEKAEERVAENMSGGLLEEPAAVCVVCGCTDDHACEGGCSWWVVDRGGKQPHGVCTSCAPDAATAKEVCHAFTLAQLHAGTTVGQSAVHMITGARLTRRKRDGRRAVRATAPELVQLEAVG